MTAQNHQELARLLDQARLEAREVPPLTRTHAELPLRDAYAIQAEGIRLRTARGERVVGLKMGLTSEAKRKQMNLDSPVYGVLTDRMQVPAGGVFRLQGTIHPKIEPEIAFRTSRELRGKITREEALEACASVMAAMEILDSRYVDFKYFSLPDVVADNSSSSMFVLGTTGAPAARAGPDEAPDVDGGERRCRCSRRSPAPSRETRCCRWCSCASCSPTRGESLPAGSIVLAGAATAAHMMKPGDEVRLTVDGLGSVSITVTQ